MVNATRVDMYNYPEAIVNNGIHPGNEYTVSAHFRTAMINGVRKTGSRVYKYAALHSETM